MKLIYSHVQSLLPSLKNIPAKQVADRLTYLGHFCDGLETINGKEVISLEVRQNRGETLGYYGLVKDLAVLWGPLNWPTPTPTYPQTTLATPIKIDSPDVFRIQSVVISNLQNKPSPPWLVEFLSLHQTNSINTLVDLTNYIMFLYGLPCHAFDTQKIGQPLVWQNNTSYKHFTTLDGTTLNLLPQNLIITSDQQVNSLSFIGGINCAIDLSTTETLIEMAVYNRSRVKADSRSLKTITEASIRLDKELDTELIPIAFNHLVSLILDLCGGQISTKLLDFYPQKPVFPSISFNPNKVSQIAGIDISTDFSLDILKKLDCQITKNQITPPSYRKDLNIEEDLVEDVIRFYGYDKIASTMPLKYKKNTDITPHIITLIEQLKDSLVSLGYDEVRSWPLVSKPQDPKTVVTTQNSINSKYPYLRQSIIQSLKSQLKSYNRYKVPSPQFFEIGKIFAKNKDKYTENYALGLYHPNTDTLRKDILFLGLAISLQESNFVEIILDNLDISRLSLKTQPVPQNPLAAVELTSQITTLDANVIYKNKQDPAKLIESYKDKLCQNLWQINITDIYQNHQDKSYKYTFRVSYFNLSDKLAKKIHLETFHLV